MWLGCKVIDNQILINRLRSVGTVAVFLGTSPIFINFFSKKMDKNDQKALSAAEAVKFILEQKGIRSFIPGYDISNGDTAWRFGDLAIRRGYETALRDAEWIRDRVPGIPETCTLLVTLKAFLQALEECKQLEFHEG
jgi:hypothetical protein